MILCICPNPSIDTFVWVEHFLPSEVNRIQKEKRFPGGKGVHVALAAAELGEKVQLQAFWGGPTGQWIRNRCEDLGVSCHGHEIDDWSRTCMTFKSKDAFRDIGLLGAGPIIHDADFENFVNEYRKHVVTSECVCMSGSWPQGAPSDAYAQLIAIAQTRNTPVFLDTTGDQLQHALTKRPTGIHLNRSEIQGLLGENDVRIAALRKNVSMALLLRVRMDYSLHITARLFMRIVVSIRFIALLEVAIVFLQGLQLHLHAA